MAYNIKYRYSFTDFKSTSTFRLDILKRDYTGSITVVDEGNEVSIKKRGSKDKQDAVIEGSELEFSLLAIKGVREFNDVIESNYRDFKVELYKDNSIYWIGYLKPENLDKEFFANKYFINFSATDGLADLKDIDYKVNTQTPKISILQVVKECLEELQLPLDFAVQLNTYETNLSNATTCTLLETFINTKRFQTVKSGRLVNTDCYKVIEEALTIFNVKLKQSEGKYYIVNNLEYDSYIYDIDYATLTQNSRSLSNLAVNINTLNFDTSAILERIRPLKTVNTTFLNRNDGESSIANWENSFTVTDGIINLESGVNSLRFYIPPVTGSNYSGVIKSSPVPLEFFNNNDSVIIKFNVTEILLKEAFINNNNGIPRLRTRIGLEKPNGTTDFVEFNLLEIIPTLITVSGATPLGDVKLTFQDNYSFFETGDYRIVVDIPEQQYTTIEEFDFTITDLEVIGTVGEEGVTAITFDKYYRATSDLNNVDNVDYTLKFGDSVEYGDIAALKIGDVNTNKWNRYNKTDNLSIQEIFTFQKLINKGYYKNYLRLKIYDYNLSIENHNVILLDGKVYQILNFTRNFNNSVIEVAIVEILTTDVGYSINQIELSSIDGDDTKTYSNSTNVTNVNSPYELPQATTGILGGVKVGAGLAIDSTTGVLSSTGSTAGNFVTLDTTQTISGSKTFNGQVAGTLKLGRVIGEPSIKSNASHLMLESLGNGTGYVSLNHYNSDNITLANGGGNVGIGTSTPTEKLQVLGTARVDSLHVRNSTVSSTMSSGRALLRFGWSNHIGAGIAGIKRTTNVTDLAFYTENGFNVEVERVRIAGNTGNVGIGTTSPSYKLDITGDVRATSNLTSNSAVFANYFRNNNSNNSNYSQFVRNGIGSVLYVNQISNSGVIATFSSGTATPNQGNKVEILANGTVTASDFTMTSDIRYKDNFRDITNPNNMISKIDTFYHTWKDEENSKETLGVSAQQLKEVLPQVVNYNEEEDKYTVSYSKIIPLLIESNKELIKKNIELEERIKKLEK